MNCILASCVLEPADDSPFCRIHLRQLDRDVRRELQRAWQVYLVDDRIMDERAYTLRLRDALRQLDLSQPTPGSPVQLRLVK